MPTPPTKRRRAESAAAGLPPVPPAHFEEQYLRRPLPPQEEIVGPAQLNSASAQLQFEREGFLVIRGLLDAQSVEARSAHASQCLHVDVAPTASHAKRGEWGGGGITFGRQRITLTTLLPFFISPYSRDRLTEIADNWKSGIRPGLGKKDEAPGTPLVDQDPDFTSGRLAMPTEYIDSIRR